METEFRYKYEVHMHTSQGSACGRTQGHEYVEAFLEAGYDGIIITDHFLRGNTAIDRSLPWEDFVEGFCKGFEDAKEAGDKAGLKVFFGWEECNYGDEYLVYGLDKAWLKAHPEYRRCTMKEQLRLVHEGGGVVVQAHPFREEWYIEEVRIYPDDVDGCEIINATHSSSKSKSHNNPEFNVKAIAYAKEQGFCTSGGSDIHSTYLFGGGMAFSTKLKDPQDFIQRLLNKEDYVITDGDHWYTRTGDLIV